MNKRSSKFLGDWFDGFLVGIIAILILCLTFWCAINVDVVTNRDGIIAARFLEGLESGLSRYQIDHGEYPIYQGPAERGGAFLCNVLFGDHPNSPQYLQYRRSIVKENPKTGDLEIVDLWGNPIHYQCDPPDQNPKSTHNPNFDLWSTGKKPKDRSGWITNWREEGLDSG